MLSDNENFYYEINKENGSIVNEDYSMKNESFNYMYDNKKSELVINKTYIDDMEFDSVEEYKNEWEKLLI